MMTPFRSLLLGLTLSSSLLLAACQREDTPVDCSQGSFYAINDSGIPVTLSLTPTDGMGATLSFELDSTTTIEEPLSAPAGTYRVQALEAGTSTVLFDSELSGETLTVDGCEGPSLVTIPMPAPTPECEPMGRHGPWTRITFASTPGNSPEVCTDYELRAEARDACGNLLTEVNEPVIWHLANPVASLGLTPRSIDPSDLSPRFLNGVATASVNSSVAQSVQISLISGGLVSPVRNVVIANTPRVIQTLIVPADFENSTATSLIACTAENIYGRPQSLYVRVVLYDACYSVTYSTTDVNLTIASARGLFEPIALTVPAGISTNTSEAIQFSAGVTPAYVIDVMTTTSTDERLSSLPINVHYNPSCLGRAF